jgi:hypothetical protein
MLALALLILTSDAAEVDAPRADARTALIDARTALADLRYDDALAAYERARTGGPYAYADVVALYRDLGIVRAYLDDPTGARAAFHELLAVDPGHVLPYTTSPKATLEFEQARAEVAHVKRTSLRASTAPVLAPDDALTVSIAVDALSARAETLAVRWRARGAATFTTVRVRMPPVKESRVVTLAPHAGALTNDADAEVALDLELVALDARGWEVHLERPDALALSVITPTPWYAQWWPWAIIGGAASALVAGATSVTAYALLQPPPTTVSATPHVRTQ